MLKISFNTIALVLALAASTFAQNTNANTTRSRQTTTTTKTTKEAAATGELQDETPAPPANTNAAGARRTARQRVASTDSAAAQAVRAAFDALIDGITRADVDAVMSVYLNSPQLLLFNNNGTVTRSWTQVRANRSSSYPNLKDVKLAVRDVRVQVIGADAALVTCQWTQTQVHKDVPETASGRLTLVFRRIRNDWKVVHTHTSPDAPDPSRLLPSEQTETTTPAKPATKP
jgi:ketosteroid isomerase-like protein